MRLAPADLAKPNGGHPPRPWLRGTRSDGVGVPEWGGPFVDAGSELLEIPPGSMFHPVVVTAEWGKVGNIGRSAFGPRVGVIEI